MNKWLIPFAVVLVGLGIATAQTKQAAKTDAEIKQEIIKQSIASYREAALSGQRGSRRQDVRTLECVPAKS